ncbi:hypothetical protein B0O80DRAFT_454120 [Mortierella sp. GBAus27b]|nr:hypothetical protein BGX31_001762 [Mortierella sp. GBA43]KAI8352262.1 hypothetical protein B0O80DRAFT_454120 [Mortierella sp. GBAus27b]
MVRCLLSLLAVAAVAIQSCAAQVVPDGVYKIAQNGVLLGTDRLFPGAPVLLDPRPAPFNRWEVINLEDDVVIIRNANASPENTALFASPVEKAANAPVLLERVPFKWRLRKIGNQIVAAREDDDSSKPLVLARSEGGYPPHAATQPFNRFNKDQAWYFVPEDDFNQETPSHCGPRRLFYHQ